jgi:putative hemolysin
VSQATQIFRLANPLVDRALGLREMERIYEPLQGCPGPEFLDRVLDALGVRIDVDRADLQRIPAEGSLVVVANHPFGGIEGMVLAKLLLTRRPDVRVFANYVLGRIPELRELFLLVDPFGGPQSVRANLRAMRRAVGWLAGDHVLALFPAGEVSHLNLRRRQVEDPPWLDTVEGLVRRSRTTVLPVYFPGRNSGRFQAAGLLHPRLRTAMLGRELLRRRGRPIEARIGSPIPWRQLASHSGEGELTSYLRSRTYVLSERPRVAAGPVQPRVTPRQVAPLASPTPQQLIVDEVASLPADNRLVDAGQEAVYVAAAPEIPNLLREIGLQRERTFREVGEGTGREIDLDPFDRSYRHLFVWNREHRELVGAYRIGLTDELLRSGNIDGLYTSTLFDYRRELFEAMGPGLEMGRSFIRPEYQKSYNALLLLWKGIGHMVLRHPDHATLFGPVSISADYRSASQRLIVAFLEQNKYAHDWSQWVRPRTPRKAARTRGFRLEPDQLGNLEDVSSFISEIEADQKGVPILLRQYLKLGGRLLGFNVDPQFSNVLDVLIMVDLRQTAPKILNRYMGREGAKRFQDHHARHAPRAG